MRAQQRLAALLSRGVPVATASMLLLLCSAVPSLCSQATAGGSQQDSSSTTTDSAAQTERSEDYFHRQSVRDLAGSVVNAAMNGWQEGNGGWRGLEVGFIRGVEELWVIFGPGGKLHPAYFLEHFHGHIMCVEGVLLLIIAYLFLQSTFKPKPHSEEPLTDKEISMLCDEWKPEPLVPAVPEDDQVQSRIISSYDGKYVVADGKRALNLLSHDFLNLANTPEMLEVASSTVEKYGVGSCGPRGFYGTIDVHLKLEEELARFMGTDEAIIYSYDIATISSIVPAFANRKDVLIIDECCGYPIQQGATLSRASVHVFKHNDTKDLERIMIMVEDEFKKEKRPLNRRLVIVEGVYACNGDLAPLDQIYVLKEKYKYRLVVEESQSFGVLGENGRGAVEHWGLKPTQVEVVCGSMGNALGSIGGWCVGTTEIVEHQRLSGSGYCFSASLPPYLATSASQSLHVMSQPEGRARMARVRGNAASMRRMLSKIPGLVLQHTPGAEYSPIIHLHLAKPPCEHPVGVGTRHAHPQELEAKHLLQRLSDRLLELGVLAGVPHYSNIHRRQPPPSLHMCATAELTEADIAAVGNALKKAVQQVL